MDTPDLNFDIPRLGEPRFDSPVSLRFVSDDERVLYDSDLKTVQATLAAGGGPPASRLAGPPREDLLRPAEAVLRHRHLRRIVPGLERRDPRDRVRTVVPLRRANRLGLPLRLRGSGPALGPQPLLLTPDVVDAIHEDGGTILGSSRGPQDVGEMVDTLQRMGIGILFALGGDGTLRGALAIAEETRRRNLPISVIGIPKTIDNDISFVQQSFGFQTAVSQTRTPIIGAHREAKGVRNGVGLVKLMGRYSGFIAAYAALANSDVNFCLVPEVPFTLAGFLAALRQRLERRGHAVVVVAEGAGQELLQADRAMRRVGQSASWPTSACS